MLQKNMHYSIRLNVIIRELGMHALASLRHGESEHRCCEMY